MAVTVDKYELPIAVEKRGIDLAKKLNFNYITVRTQISQKPNKPTLGIKCIKVEFNDDEWADD
jgi:hypothetical protein